MNNYIRKMISSNIRTLVHIIQNSDIFFADNRKVFIITDEITQNQIEDIQNRLTFYVHGKLLEVRPNLPLAVALSSQPVLVFGDKNIVPNWLWRFRAGIFDIDYRRNLADGWQWSELSSYCAGKAMDLNQSWCMFREYIDQLRQQSFNRTYIFGTGPSLEKAMDRDWSDGFRIVCNTIVRDPALWNHINPHIIVAGDAIYHFGHTRFARAFREDLVQRLSETDTYFLYPALFDPIVRRDLRGFEKRLIPIPDGGRKIIHGNLYDIFALPPLDNVLTYQLLPLATTLSKEVYLWGFDGRAPNDKLFWANSSRHSYPELLPELQRAHPAFFDGLVPTDNPSQYVQKVHGNILEELLQSAEDEGWHFVMMHPSWTPVLQKRFME